MPSTFAPAVKTLLACGLLAAVFVAPGSVLAAEGKTPAENPKVKAQEEAIAKADEAALKELEKVKAEYDKKLAEAQKKAAVARIGARNKAIEELTKDKKKAILAEKLDEAMALKEKIEGMQKEADALLAEGNEGVEIKVDLKDPKTVNRLMVGRWNHLAGGKIVRVKTFLKDGRIEDVATDGSHNNWKPEQRPVWKVLENGTVVFGTKDNPTGDKLRLESENTAVIDGGMRLERVK